MKLYEYDTIPGGLLDCEARQLCHVLEGPSLLHLPGLRDEPLFLSVLLHGNEDTGWEAIRQLLRDYAGRELPRALSLFIGNIEAAAVGQRRLDSQPDYNRIWSDGDSEEHALIAQVVERMREKNVFASIDIHNNTGLNPHYACINVLEQPFLHLATLFSRTVIYFTKPDGVQSMAMSKLCPAITVECGKVGQGHGVQHARELIEAALHLDHFPEHKVPTHDFELYHTVAVVKIPEGVDFDFEVAEAELNFPADLDRLNFRELPSGTEIARVNNESTRLEAWNEAGENAADRYFERRNGALYTRRPVMPSMLTLNKTVIRQDCLCYLMERLAFPGY